MAINKCCVYALIASCAKLITLEIADASDVKQSLLQLSRGSTTTPPVFEVRRMVSILERENTRELAFPELWNQINGAWKLLYTNNANDFRQWQASERSSLLESVQQNIDGSLIDNVLNFNSPLGKYRVSLNHFAQVTSTSRPAQLAIDLEAVSLSSKGELESSSSKTFRLPLPGPSILRRGFFDVRVICRHRVTNCVSYHSANISLLFVTM